MLRQRKRSRTKPKPHKLSRRMLVAAVMFFPDINMDDPIQLTLLAFAVTVTVTVEPAVAAAKSLGDCVTVPVKPESDSIFKTSD